MVLTNPFEKFVPSEAQLAILRDARRRITDPAHWTRAAYARDADGLITEVEDPTATRWCGMGSIFLSARKHFAPEGWDGTDYITIDIGGTSVETRYGTIGHQLTDKAERALWVAENDRNGHAAILAAFDTEIETLKATIERERMRHAAEAGAFTGRV